MGVDGIWTRILNLKSLLGFPQSVFSSWNMSKNEGQFYLSSAAEMLIPLTKSSLLTFFEEHDTAFAGVLSSQVHFFL